MDVSSSENRAADPAGHLVKGPMRVAFGLIFVLISLTALWWSDAGTGTADLIRKSAPISAESVDAAHDGLLVSVTGKFEPGRLLGDPGILDFGPYIELNRKAEIFAWVERDESQDIYKKIWTENPPDSDSFYEPDGHRNPEPKLLSRTFTVKEASIGLYRLDLQALDLPVAPPVTITRENFIPFLRARPEGGYIFVGKGSLEKPEIGDARISYTAIESGAPMTLFGKLDGDSVRPYVHPRGRRLYTLVRGTRQDAISSLPASTFSPVKILALLGFFALWGGLFLCFEPMNSRFGLVPSLDGDNRLKTAMALLGVAIAVSIILTVVSSSAHLLLGPGSRCSNWTFLLGLDYENLCGWRRLRRLGSGNLFCGCWQ